MEANIENFPLSNLSSRYQIGRQALYNRMYALGIKPQKAGNRAYVTSRQLDHLDSLHDHIVAGGTLAEFMSEVDTLDMSTGGAVTTITEFTGNSMGDLTQLITTAVCQSIAAIISPSPIAYMECLEKAIEKKWMLATSEVRSLIGIQPKADRDGLYRRGGFVFKKVGKVGRESAWIADRLNISAKG